MENQSRVIRVLAWTAMLALFWLSPPALALVCHQKSVGAHEQSVDARIYYQTVRTSAALRTNEVIWHKHVDIPIQCSWQDGTASDLSAQAGSNEPVLAFLHPQKAADEHDGLALGVSVNSAPVVYKQSSARIIDTGLHMPTYSAERVCEHWDAYGCRHWREAPNRDYREPIDFVVPLDLYVRRLPGAMTRITDQHVLLQLGGELNTQGHEGVQVTLRGLSSLARTPCRSAVNVMPATLDFNDAWQQSLSGSRHWRAQRHFDVRVKHQCNGLVQQVGMKASFQMLSEQNLFEDELVSMIGGQSRSALDLILLDDKGRQVPLQQEFALDPVAMAYDGGMLNQHFEIGHLWHSPSTKQMHIFNSTLVLNITYK